MAADPGVRDLQSTLAVRVDLVGRQSDEHHDQSIVTLHKLSLHS